MTISRMRRRDGPIVPEAYCFFLDFLLDRTAESDPETGETIWKWVNDPEWHKKLKPMSEVERERAAAKAASASGASLNLKTHMSDIGKVHLQSKKEKKEKKKEKRNTQLKSVAKKARACFPRPRDARIDAEKDEPHVPGGACCIHDQSSRQKGW